MPLPLVTERLRLRPATIDDLGAWHAIARDAETEWYGKPSSTRHDAQANLQIHMAHQASHGFALWAVELRRTGEVIGVTGLGHLWEGTEIEVGYRFLRAHWGHGYATEAAGAAIAFGFGELGLDRIVAVTEPQNVASRRVMEKCGLSFVGVSVHEGRTHVKYAITS